MGEPLRLLGVDKTYSSGVRALNAVSMDVPAGSLVAVIGPSGCGKTTLLKAVAGVEEIDRGDIRIGERSIKGLSPAQRPTAMVFQTDTLFPDLTVRENVAFGLRLRKAEVAEAVEVALLRFRLVGVADRYPHELSGGQQRRTAIARALVLAPEVLLLDEPLSGLDDVLRAQLASIIRTTQRRFGLTTLFVTHDQGEALSLADLVVVLREGMVEQVGTPQEIYRRPASLFAASFVGRANLLEVTARNVAEGRGIVDALGREHVVAAHADLTDGPAVLMVRPEAVRVRPYRSVREWTEVLGSVGLITDVLYYGSRTDYLVETEHGMVTAVDDPTRPQLAVGEGVDLVIDASQGWLLPHR